MIVFGLPSPSPSPSPSPMGGDGCGWKKDGVGVRWQLDLTHPHPHLGVVGRKAGMSRDEHGEVRKGKEMGAMSYSPSHSGDGMDEMRG